MSNPYQSSLEAIATPAKSLQAPRLLRLRILSSSLLLFASLVVMLLLNGQYFTNALIALVFIVLSSAAWVSLAFEPKGQRIAYYVLLFHLILVSIATSTLWQRYADQEEFNDAQQHFKIQTADSKDGKWRGKGDKSGGKGDKSN